MVAFNCLHNSISGQPYGTYWLSANECRSESKRLFDQIKTHYAGTHELYPQYRLWSMLYWQPVYLAVSAVHLNHGTVDLLRIQQIRHQQQVYGYIEQSLHFTPCRDSTPTLIAQQSQNLKTALRQYLRIINEYAKYKPRQAWGLVADCIAMALLNLKQKNSALSKQDITQWLQHWLLHMGLSDRKGNWLTNLSSCDESDLRLNRRTCCLYYLVDAEDICSTCPKQKKPTYASNLILKNAS